MGNVRSLRKYRGEANRIVHTGISNSGYKYVSLNYKGVRTSFYIHRLVADYFIANPNNLPEVNHKDENKLNNRADNLEWCTHLYNIRYGKTREKISKAQIENSIRPVKQIDLNGTTIAIYRNAAHAKQITGIDSSAIIKVAKERAKFITAGKFVWRYVDADDLFVKDSDSSN